MGKHFKKKDKSSILLTLLSLIFILGIIISLSYIAKWYLDNKENKEIENKLADVVTTKQNEESEEIGYNINFEELKNINKETVGWLKVNETDIEYVVVKAKNNSYYLNHNFEKKYNIAGWLFADYKNNFDGTDKNIVIYGHNRKDGSMFGTLKNILKEEWYSKEENLVIDFVTEQEQAKYQVFSIYKIENEDYYIDTEFINNEFAIFIKTLKERSIKDFGIEVTQNDSILTLSTCADNNKYRVVLHAKKLYDME